MKKNMHREITNLDLETVIKDLNKEEKQLLEEKIKQRKIAIKNKTKIK